MPEVGKYAYWHLSSAFCWFLAASMPQHVRQQHRTCPVPGFNFFRPHCELGLSMQLSCKLWAGAARAAGHGMSLCLLPTRVLRCSTRECCLEEKQREWSCVWSPAECSVSLGNAGRDKTWRSHAEIRVGEWQFCGPWEFHQLGSVKNHQPQNKKKKNLQWECYLNVFTISLSSVRSKLLSRVIWKWLQVAGQPFTLCRSIPPAPAPRSKREVRCSPGMQMRAVSKQGRSKPAPLRGVQFALNFNPDAVDMMHNPVCTMQSVSVNSLRSELWIYTILHLYSVIFYKDMLGIRKHFYLNSKPAFA